MFWKMFIIITQNDRTGVCFGVRKNWVQILVQLLASCATLSNLSNLSESVFFLIHRNADYNSYF